jgi:ZIP family zinc transporter
VPTWLVPCVAVASFAANAAISRVGCTCRADEEHAGGTGSAAALAVHRFLEGAALALSGAVAAVALALHAVGEGLAVGALLSGRPRALATWLAVMCSAPAVGAVTADAVPAVQVAEPLLMAVATGVLAQAARVSFRAALLRRPAGRHLTTAPVAAAAVSASLTALAVYGVG